MAMNSEIWIAADAVVRAKREWLRALGRLGQGADDAANLRLRNVATRKGVALDEACDQVRALFNHKP